MKVTYNEVLSANGAIQNLMKNGAASVAPLAALRLARAARVIGQEVEAFEAGRIALIKQYAPEPDAEGNQRVPPERTAEFTAALAKLTKESVEVDIQRIDLADFGTGPISLTALIGLEWLIDTVQEG